MQVVPLSKESPQLEAIVQILSQLARKGQTADFLQILEQSYNYMFLDLIVSSLFKKLDSVFESAILVQSQKDFPELINP